MRVGRWGTGSGSDREICERDIVHRGGLSLLRVYYLDQSDGDAAYHGVSQLLELFAGVRLRYRVLCLVEGG